MIKEILAGITARALDKAKTAGELQFDVMPNIVIELPKNRAFGDYATNVALLLKKDNPGDPRKLAAMIVSYIESEDEGLLENTEVAGAGFINFRIKTEKLAASIFEILKQGEKYGNSDIGKGKTILAEYVSANPTGPVHIAHARGGVLGDTLMRLLKKLGYNVIKEFYINDADNSTQMNQFAKSLLLRYRQLFGHAINEDELGYRGDYMIDIAKQVRDEFGQDLAVGEEEEIIARFRSIGMKLVLEGQKVDLKDFGVEFDNWYSEQTLHESGAVLKALDTMKELGVAYEEEGALWLKTTDFGDEKDRVLVRGSGMPTYIAADAAYHKIKFDRGADLLIDIWGPDHHGYIARTKAAIAAMGNDPEKLKILIYQIVKLFRGNEEVRLSKRTGAVITLREVLDEVGRDVTRFFLLMRSHETDLSFDIELAKKQSAENPVFYVQYAHARINSVLTSAETQGYSQLEPDSVNISLISHEKEIELIKKLLDFPDEIFHAAEVYEPHRLTAYAVELARAYHYFYEACRILGDDAELSKARLMLCKAVKLVLANTLDLLGVSAPEHMEKRD